jgi:hypothetical protein
MGRLKILLLANATGSNDILSDAASIYDPRHRQRRLQQQTWP